MKLKKCKLFWDILRKIGNRSLLLIISCLLAFLCSLLFIIIINYAYPSDSGERELVEPISKDWFANAFFDSHNRIDCCNAAPELIEDSIIIIDIHEVESDSKRLAEILEKIGELNPRCIGLDFFMSYDRDSIGSSNLTHALNDINSRHNLIVASLYNDRKDIVEQSYFNINNSIKSGVVNKSNLLELKNEYRGQTTFTTRIAQTLNVNCKLHDQYIVNFRYKKFGEYTISSVEQVEELKLRVSEIEQKIFIIGSKHPINDNKNLPFVLDQINQAHGCQILAHELSSLMNLNKKDKHRTPLREMSTIDNLIFCIIALILYMLLLKTPVLLHRLIRFLSSKIKTPAILYKIIHIISSKNRTLIIKQGRLLAFLQVAPHVIYKVFVLTVAEIIIIRISFYWTENKLSIPDIFLFAISLLFVEDIYKKLSKIITK